MPILRNREIKLFIALLVLLGAAATTAGFFIAPAACILTGAASVLFIALFMIFTGWRYRQLQNLTGYLKRVNGGDYALDLRDNTEGELSILRNELYKVTVMLREQNEALLADKVKLADAISDISHQLKTPLTSMLVMTDLLCDKNLPEDKRTEFTGRLRAQLERINWLVSSLLKLSKLDAGTAELKPQRITASELFFKACQPVFIPMELKDQTLAVEDNGAELLCDVNWTAEAMLNIVKNCAEHTPQGGRIEIIGTQNPLYMQIEIRDNGPGIAKEDLPYIFNRFYRGRNASPDSVGIGLAMAAAIIQQQGGSIMAQSSGAGSAFTIRFPRCRG